MTTELKKIVIPTIEKKKSTATKKELSYYDKIKNMSGRKLDKLTKEEIEYIISIQVKMGDDISQREGEFFVNMLEDMEYD